MLTSIVVSLYFHAFKRDAINRHISMYAKCNKYIRPAIQNTEFPKQRKTGEVCSVQLQLYISFSIRY